MEGFREKLKKRQEQVGSLLCVGLDPMLEKCPGKYWENSRNTLPYTISDCMREVIQKTAPFASMFKLQSAHYEALPEGRKVLHFLIRYIREHFLEIPVFLDCKRGDIGRTQQKYGTAHLVLDGVDGMNFSPYMGRSCLESPTKIELNTTKKAIVGLGRTSNPDAWEIQDALMPHPETGEQMRFWEWVAERTLKWAEEVSVSENAGLVMGAAHDAALLNGYIFHPEANYSEGEIYSWHLSRARELVGSKLWFLIPGIGAQGGYVEETVKTAYAGLGSMVINSSSGIIFADDPREEAKKLRDQINSAL